MSNEDEMIGEDDLKSGHTKMKSYLLRKRFQVRPDENEVLFLDRTD
jgi:hypothetical protein